MISSNNDLNIHTFTRYTAGNNGNKYCHNSRCPFRFCGCTSETLCPNYQEEPDNLITSDHTISDSTSPIPLGCVPNIQGYIPIKDNDSKVVESSKPKGEVIKLKAKLIKKPTFEDKLNAWCTKVIKAYKMSKEDPEDSIVIFDTYKMVRDVDELIAEAFGHTTVFDDE